MDRVLQDIRLAFRSLTRNPGFAAVAIFTLALGIGANTAIFSVVNAVLLRPLPYPDADQLTTVFHYYPSLGNLEAGMAVPTLLQMEQETRSFAHVAAATGWGVNATGSGEPQRLNGGLVTGRHFTTLGVPAAVGRTLLPSDAEGDGQPVIVIGNGLWTSRFGSDPAAVGRSLQLNGRSFEIVGVMPAEFRDPFNPHAELWAPLTFAPWQHTARTNEFMVLTARLNPGVTHAQAAGEMAALAERLKADNPGAYPADWTLRTRPLAQELTGDARPALLVLLGAVGLVLLIACANVANLLLARAAARNKEVAVRAALGAGCATLVRQLLTESLLLAAIGAGVALMLASFGIDLLVALQPGDDPRLRQISLDGTVLLYTLGIALLTGLLFGLVPALRGSRIDLQGVLRQAGRGSGGAEGRAIRRALVVAELALALVLLVGSGLLLRSFANLTQVNPGFDPSNLLTAELFLPTGQYNTDTMRIAFTEQIIERIGTLPGVRAVGTTSSIPFNRGETRSFHVEGFTPGESQPQPWGDYRVVSAGYREAMQIPLLRGRFFTAEDRMGGRPVTVVDRDLADRYWPGADPIGRRIGFSAGDSVNWMEVVGVVEHTAAEGLEAQRRVQIYRPYAQVGSSFMVLAVRTTGSPDRAADAVRGAVRSIDPALPLAQVRSMEAIMDGAVGARRFSMLLLAIFAGLALALAAVGIYGVISFEVSRRSQELGLRMALGAERGAVLRMVLGQGLWLATMGIAIGVGGSLAVTRFLSSQLYGVGATDPVTFTAVVAVLLGIALLASYLPARRATRVDPMVSLRSD